MKDEIFSRLVAHIEDDFQAMDSKITIALRYTNEEYIRLSRRQTELEKRFPFIESALEGEGALNLTAEEHAGLVEYLGVRDEMENLERLNLYYAGHRDGFAYLKKIGVI
jgi:hypothetical protein